MHCTLLFFLIYGVAYSIAMGFYALGRLPMIITNEASVIGLIPHILFIGLEVRRLLRF